MERPCERHTHDDPRRWNRPGPAVSISNLGYERIVASAEAPIVVSVKLGEGLKAKAGGARGYTGSGGRSSFNALKCEEGGQTITCTGTTSVPAYVGMEVIIPVEATGTPGPQPMETSVSGGGSGTPALTAHGSVEVGTSATGFGVESYELRPEDEHGNELTQAGAHPFQLTTTMALNEVLEPRPNGKPPEETAPALVHNLHFVLPPGLLGNITVIPQCSGLEFSTILKGDVNLCGPKTAVGVARVKINEPAVFGGDVTESVPSSTCRRNVVNRHASDSRPTTSPWC